MRSWESEVERGLLELHLRTRQQALALLLALALALALAQVLALQHRRPVLQAGSRRQKRLPVAPQMGQLRLALPLALERTILK